MTTVFMLSKIAIPSNGAAPGYLMLVADPTDVGVVIALTTTVGTLDGVATENVTLDPPAPALAAGSTPVEPVCRSADSSKAQNTTACATLLGAGKSGQAVVTARAPNTAPIVASINVFGPPIIVPSGISLVNGGSATITVTDPGAKGAITCTMTQGVGLTLAGSGLSYTVSASGMPTSTTTATLTCMDPFAQTTVATYTFPKP